MEVGRKVGRVHASLLPHVQGITKKANTHEGLCRHLPLRGGSHRVQVQKGVADRGASDARGGQGRDRGAYVCSDPGVRGGGELAVEHPDMGPLAATPVMRKEL